MKDSLKIPRANWFFEMCIFYITLFCFTHIKATANEPNDIITTNFEREELKEVFGKRIQINGSDFFNKTSGINIDKKAFVHVINPDKVLANNKGIKKRPIEKQQITITGTILDEKGIPLPGANITIKDTNIGGVTNFDGNFELSVPEGSSTLIISYVGFKTKEVEIGSSITFTINLELDPAQLDEVIVVGYGTLAKKKVTGSVISINSKSIVEVPSLSPESAIIAQVAGVQVQEVSGEPGAAPNIKVRGSGSISAGNDPLFVIDGIPISRNLTTSTIGGVSRRRASFQPPPVNPLATLNPNDIESIQILKDASAAAIYGSRGGNGVLLITTKKGANADKGKFSFDSYFSIQNVANKIDLMNAEELIDFTTDARNNNYLSSVAGASINDPIGEGNRGSPFFELPESFINWDGTDTDWQDVLFKTGTTKSYNFSYASPIKNKTSFFASASYFSQEGILDKSNFDRYNLILNLNSKLTDKLNLDLRVAPSITENERIPASAPYFARPPGIVYSALVHSPTVSPFNSDGTINQLNNQSHLGGATTTASNPLAILDAIDDEIFQFQTRASLALSYAILPELTFKTFGGTYVNLYNQDFFRGNSLLYRDATEGESYGQATSSTEVNWVWENTLNWEKEFDNHSLNAVLGYTAQRDEITMQEVLADNFPDDLVSTISGGQVFGGNSIEEQWTLASALLRMNYSYKDKYLFTGTIRSDKSSRFGSNNQTGYFPSFSAGWRLSEEALFNPIDAISELKLRFSWGETGNFEIPNYGAIGLLSPDNYNLGGNEINGLIQSTIRNSELTWEKSQQTNVGLELGLFNNRIFVLADYYNTKTSDLLLNVSISSVSGFQTTLQNLGEVENKGFEIALRTKNFVGDFSWDTDFNLSANNNEVLSLNENNEPIFSEGSAGIRHVTRVGDPIGSYFGYVVDGIYQTEAEIAAAPVDTEAPDASPGDFRFKDVNGDGEITPDDRTVIGSYFPDFTWGINNKFKYKELDFSFLIQGVEGNEILNLTSRHLKNGEANFNSYAVFNDRWRSVSEPGNGNIPRADRQTGNHGNNNRPSSFQVEDGSFIRLRNVTIGYSFPSDKIFGDNIDKLRVYVTGTNLFTITDYLGYNPEVSNISNNSLTPGEDYGAYPLTRSITMGVNLTF